MRRRLLQTPTKVNELNPHTDQNIAWRDDVDRVVELYEQAIDADNVFEFARALERQKNTHTPRQLVVQ